ncbi:hypothetical protein PsW64_01953 [Pseudovibrio sp. W64]|nr:hypothetical protein PsW64_01953 [Pseudovibrio sp. W64]
MLFAKRGCCLDLNATCSLVVKLQKGEVKCAVLSELVAFIRIHAPRSNLFGGASSCRLIEFNQTEHV